ncbi:MAG TPA: hypothetical protein VMB52_04245 [Verrucomicrobiae bacterium]|nr:hypothetical protein [Verrucomicrobiae bacterium]
MSNTTEVHRGPETSTGGHSLAQGFTGLVEGYAKPDAYSKAEPGQVSGGVHLLGEEKTIPVPGLEGAEITVDAICVGVWEHQGGPENADEKFTHYGVDVVSAQNDLHHYRVLYFPGDGGEAGSFLFEGRDTPLEEDLEVAADSADAQEWLGWLLEEPEAS